MDIKLLFFLCLFTFGVGGCSQTSKKVPTSYDIAIRNVTIVDVVNGSLSPSQTVFITKDKIVKIAETKASDGGGVKSIVEAEGKFLMPGLAEMHAHIPSPAPGRDLTKETLFLYLSNGITTIRGMLGHPNHLTLREKIKVGKIVGPRVWTAGPSLNGNSVQTEEEARSKVIAQKEAGYDFLKLHPGIKRPVFDEIVRTAKEVGIPYAGHVSIDVGVRHAMASNYASIDHVDGFLEGLVPASAGVEPGDNGFFGFNFSELADPEIISELVGLSKTNEVWVVPTQSLFERWASPANAEMLGNEPEMKYMPQSTIDSWIKRKNDFLASDGYSKDRWNTFIDIRRDLIMALQEKGYGLLLGSDAPQIFNVPGFSIHHEMAGMMRSGLTNHAIIQSGTINPAKFFGVDDQLGAVKEGFLADLILLNGNPLDKISNIQSPAAVFVNGQYLDRESIDAELKKIEERVGNM